MTDQPFQPQQGVPAKAGKNEPYPVVPGPSGQQFQVMSLALEFGPGLYVSQVQLDSDDEGDTGAADNYMVSCGDVKFTAKVQFTGDAGWKIGWVQTAESADFWVLYKHSEHAARHRRKMRNRMKDGDSRGCWYGSEAREKANSRVAVTVEMSDDPNISFCYPHHTGGPGLQALKGWTPAACGGQKEFWAWLVAFREGGDQPPEMVFLHYIHWHVLYDCQIHDNGGKPAVTFGPGSGAVLLKEDAGQGGVAPVLSGPPPRPHHEDNEVVPQ